MLDTRDIKCKDGFHSLEQFDTKTGHLKTQDMDELDGTHVHDDYDPETGAFFWRTETHPAKKSKTG